MSTAGKLLQCVLEQPAVVESVRALEPAQLSALIREVGVEDSGELLALATEEQFAYLVDESMWTQQRPGDNEVFDHARFVVWLEVMFEGGADLVVERLRALPEETLAVAFSGQLLVLDIETLGMGMAGASPHEAELVEKALDACLYLEFENYTLVSKRGIGWDTVIEALLALDKVDHATATRILEDCCRASTEYVDDNGGLSTVLSAEEMLEEDASAGREQRRSELGFVTPADARAFLRLAEQTPVGSDGGVPQRDAITRAYFRDLAPPPPTTTKPPPPNRLLQVLTDFGVVRSDSPALPASRDELALRDMLGSTDQTYRGRREQELVYLANLLMASPLGLSPLEAAQRTVAAFTAGLEHLLDQGHSAEELMTRAGADQIFRLGWALGEAASTRPSVGLEAMRQLQGPSADRRTGAGPDVPGPQPTPRMQPDVRRVEPDGS